MPRGLRILLVCAVALMVISAGGLAALMLVHPVPQPTSSTLGALGGPFTLTAIDGRTVTDQTYRGKWVLIYFGYTSCPDACPTALNNMGVALDRLGAEASRLQPIFVTVDPKRDKREVLAEYLKSFDPRIVALTGTEDEIAAVAMKYHLYVSAHPVSSDGNYLVDHSGYFYLLNPDATFVNILHGDLSGDEMAARLRDLMRSRV
jgi:protein SCO1